MMTLSYDDIIALRRLPPRGCRFDASLGICV